jgi:methyl-accepting chemotaxis protein
MAIYILLFVFFISRTFIQPLNRTVAMISGLEKGDLDHRLQMERKDEIGILAGSLDRFADNLKHEVLTAFQRLADGDFTFKAQGLIAAPLARANTSLNQLVSELQQVGERINGRSAEVADSSQALSQGATEQAASLEEISASLHELTSQTKKNADNAGLADRLTGQVQGSAQNGNQQMQQMVAAMADINDSGQNISKIIKVIDEIAFQTNLLALNAAVEAARAGVHGKGFAVVAEEVRNLAGRSAKAAQETAELIEGSLAKAKNGAEIAEHTAKALKEIVQGIGKITDLAGEIATASNEQAEGIDQINIGISQIDQVTQQNTATAEESAAAAEDLSGQAVRLHTMLSRFKLESSRILAPPPTATPAQRPSYSPEKSAAAQKREPAKKEEWGTSGPSSSPPEMIALDDDEFGRY